MFKQAPSFLTLSKQASLKRKMEHKQKAVQKIKYTKTLKKEKIP